MADVQQRVRSVAPTAQIVAHRESIGPLLHSLRLLQWVAFGLVLMLSGAAAAAVVLAARGSLDTHRPTIEVMHGVGATDLQVTHLFQRRIAIDALVGSIGGAIAAAILLAADCDRRSLRRRPDGRRDADAVDLVLLALLPFVLAALATWVARTAVLSALRRRYDRSAHRILLLLYALGFVLFAFTLGKPAAAGLRRRMPRWC